MPTTSQSRPHGLEFLFFKPTNPHSINESFRKYNLYRSQHHKGSLPLTHVPISEAKVRPPGSHQPRLWLFLGPLSPGHSGPGPGQVGCHPNHACSVHRSLWSPLHHPHHALPDSPIQDDSTGRSKGLYLSHIRSHCRARTGRGHPKTERSLNSEPGPKLEKKEQQLAANGP